MIEQFAEDVRKGLSGTPKSLPSKYFYDKIGSALFAEIMKLPEYYLTNAEFEILQKQAIEIIKFLKIDKSEYFELVELGAGDGFKTIELLKSLEQQNFKYDYIPVDISKKALDQLEDTLQEHLPGLNIQKKQGDYFQIMHELKNSDHNKVVLFLGSNIGNMSDDAANDFLKELSENLEYGDKLILGVDVIKATDIVLPAYNDSQGVTKDFNLNLLRRINRELGGNFDIDKFEHQPHYNEDEGVARSFLSSKIHQEVFIEALDMTIAFEAGEKIATEISRKYNDEVIKKITKNTSLTKLAKFTDCNVYFADYIFEKQK